MELTANDVKEHVQDILETNGTDCDWADYYFWMPFENIDYDLMQETPEDACNWLVAAAESHKWAGDFVQFVLIRLGDRSMGNGYNFVMKDFQKNPSKEYIEWYNKLTSLCEKKDILKWIYEK